MMGDQYDGAAFAEWTGERSYKILSCMHVNSCERVVQENALESLRYMPTEHRQKFGLPMHANIMPSPARSSPFAPQKE